MPLVFEKISFNTFLLFFVPLLLVLIFPVYSGVWGGTLALDTKENLGTTKCKTINSFFNFFGIYGILVTILILLNLLSLLVLFASYHIYMIFILLFAVVCFINFLILSEYFYKKKDGKELIFINLLPAFLPSIGGCLFIIPYYSVFNDFTDLFGMSLVSNLPLILPIFFSSYAFFQILFVERGLFLLLLIGFALFLIGFPRLLLEGSFSNEYFSKMKYGSIPVSIVVPSDCVRKYPGKTNIGTILFNSGSELYVSLDPKQKDDPQKDDHPVLLYLKKGKCSEKVYPNQIIRIPYKDLTTLPRF